MFVLYTACSAHIMMPAVGGGDVAEDVVAHILGPWRPEKVGDREAWRRGEASFVRTAAARWKPKRYHPRCQNRRSR